MNLPDYVYAAEDWLIRDGSFVAVLLLLAGAAWFMYTTCRLAVSRLLVSFHWLRTCFVALLLMLVPALVLYGWEYGVEGLLHPSAGAAASGEGGHILSVYFNSIYPGIPHLEPALETLKGPHLLLLVAGIIGYLLISGVLLSLFVNVLQNKVKNIEQGDEPCVRLKNHLVLIGRGPLVVTYLRYLLEKEAGQEARQSRWGRLWHRACKIVLLTEDSVPALRERIKRDMDKSILQRLIFMHGARNRKAELEGLWLKNCREIVLLGDTARPDWDDVNVETLSILSEVLTAGGKPVSAPRPCTLYFERFTSYTLFLELFERCHAGEAKGNKESAAPVLPGLRLEPMCPYKNWADEGLRIMQHEAGHHEAGAEHPALPDDALLSYNSENTVHLVIIGMSRMGMGLAIEAANLLHYPNYVRDKRCKTRITLIDANAEQEMAHWRLSTRAYFDAVDYSFTRMEEDGVLHPKEHHRGWLDTELHFIQAPAESDAVQELLAGYAREKNTLLTVAVCLQNARQSMSVGLNLPAAFYESQAIIPNPGSPAIARTPTILIRQDVSKGLLELLQNNVKNKYSKVRAFGMLDSELALKPVSDEAAMVAAAMYNARGEGEAYLEDVARIYREMQDESPLRQYLRFITQSIRNVKKKLAEQQTEKAEKDRPASRREHLMNRVRNLKETFTAFSAFRQEMEQQKKNKPEKWHSAPHWKRLSNRYFAASFRSKILSLRAEETRMSVEQAMEATLDIPRKLKGADVLAQVEHNRWLSEKLLIGYVPLTEEERAAVNADEQKSQEQSQGERNRLKAMMRHYDIIPYDELPLSSQKYCKETAAHLYCLLPSVRESISSTAPKKR